jgi:alpha-glucosidase
LIRQYEAVLPKGGWPSWVLGNHDQKRIASRVGTAQAPVAMMMLLTLRGTPTLYYGDELGLENVPIPPERAQDPFGLAHPEQGRDPVRTPMPWDGTEQAGFTTGEPWLPLGADHAAMSVAAQQREPALSLGDWASCATDGDVLAYSRTFEGRRCVVVLNLESRPKTIRFEEAVQGRIALSTHAGRVRQVQDEIEIEADEGIIIVDDGGKVRLD